MFLEEQLNEIKQSVESLAIKLDNNGKLPSYLLNVNISVTEFAKVTDQHAETIKRHIKQGKINAHKEGKNFAIPLNELIKVKGL